MNDHAGASWDPEAPRFIVLHRETGETLICEHAPSLAALVQMAAQQHVSLAHAALAGKKLGRLKLDGIDLSGADLSRADLVEASLVKALLREAALDGAALTGANLESADLMHANLVGADLTGARLHGANLTGAELAGADLSNADLSWCNLDEANLTGATLEGANLEGTSLLRAHKDKVAEERAETQKELERLVFRPGQAALVQLGLMLVQYVTFLAEGPFMLFWFVGVTCVNSYLMCIRSKWWGLGLIWQLAFLWFLWGVIGFR